ncbi:hypothetical protein BC830DRAFT_1115307 [Chytriomyces sp. MP71]|nr:hypothetical protein BC830DRAFT_1115307 [Chytriomyces sp. MP71]
MGLTVASFTRGTPSRASECNIPSNICSDILSPKKVSVFECNICIMLEAFRGSIICCVDSFVHVNFFGTASVMWCQEQHPCPVAYLEGHDAIIEFISEGEVMFTHLPSMLGIGGRCCDTGDEFIRSGADDVEDSGNVSRVGAFCCSSQTDCPQRIKAHTITTMLAVHFLKVCVCDVFI